MGTELPVGALVDVLRGAAFTLFFIVAFVMMVIILLQEGKGGGLAGAFGGAGAETFGVKAGTVNKLTAWIATAFLGLALIHAGLTSASGQRDFDASGPSTEEFEPGENPDDAPGGGESKGGESKGDEGAGGSDPDGE